MPVIAVFILILAAAFGGGLVANKGDISTTVNDIPGVINYALKGASPTPEPQPTEYPLQNLFPTDELKKIQYVAPLPTIDPNPFVNCNISKNCGGGSKLLRRSVCDQSTCCGFNNGSWIFYESKSQCDVDQNSANRQNIPNYTYPTYVPLPTWAPLPTLIPWPTYAPMPTFAPYPTMAPYVYVQPTLSPDQCKSQVVSYFAPLFQSCIARFGGNSGGEACTQILTSERDRAMSNCGN